MRKLLQLKMYSFLSSRWGMTFCVVGLFVTMNTFFQILQLLVSRETGMLVSQEYTRNVGGRDMHHIMCNEPIDIVYTWVNGSDPKHKRAVLEYKRAIRDPNMRACNQTEVPDKDHCYKDEDTASRFIDNEELRYSLRSIETFAPWVRHVYLVTNGQVPSWVNTEHPRLSIITHSQIFPNSSHLPTFSSPSIEVHLHRIPGLSKKFIYLNDDVMFGRDVYPDDFFTNNAGQKVFLSWAVPNCAEGCPPNWVGDGYCDLACNVSACDFDAHDCDNYTAPASNSLGNSGNVDNSQRYKNYCSKGCPDSWIGDKYCDRMCKNLECGFDAGDCGVEDIFGSMHGAQITNNTHMITLPSGTPSVYFNLSEIVGGATITDGSHDNVELVRTATISQKFKIMTLTFHRNISLQDVMLSITAENTTAAGNKTVIEKSFNITLDTIIHPTNDSNASSSNTTTANNSAAQSTLSIPGAPSTSHASPDLNHATTSSGGTTGVVPLEPAQQPPKDVAIENNIKSGSGGLPNQAASPNGNSNAAPAMQSVVPVEQAQAVPPVQSAAIGEPGAPAQQEVTSKSSQQFAEKGSEKKTSDTISEKAPEKTAEKQAEKQQAEKQQAEKQQAEKQQAEKQQAEKQQAEKQQPEKQQTEKQQTEKQQTEKQQTEKQQPEKQLDKQLGEKNDQGNLTTKQTETHTSNPNVDSQTNPASDLQESLQIMEFGHDAAIDNKPEARQPPGGYTDKNNDEATKDTLDQEQKSGHSVTTQSVAQRAETEQENHESNKPAAQAINGGVVPEANDQQENLEQKFVLVDPDAGDSSGALKLPGKEVTETDGGVPLREEQDVPRDGAFKGKVSNSELFKLTKNQRVSVANDEQSPPEEANNNKFSDIGRNHNPQKRSILSIPIYETSDRDAPFVKNVTSTKYAAHDNYSTKKAEYERWWNAKTEQKKQDMEQMEKSKKELEELEIKLQQNRDFSKQIADSGASSFPWETTIHETVYEMKGGGRKLLDDFADSLKHVNKLFTQAFGPSARKVPAHMPHMIDRDIMEELQARWPKEWEATSSHRLRSGQDMQYAFAYFYYLIHARVEYNLTNVWRTELDIDKDNELNDNELRTLGVHLHGAPLKPAVFAELKERLVNTCLTLRANETLTGKQAQYEDEELEEGKPGLIPCPITIEVISHDNKTSEDIKKVFSKKLKYRHQIEGTDEVAFLMIGNNDTVVQGKLDGIRTKRQKFICLNDNMNHSSPDTPAVVRVLHDLYTALLPLPSSFELPPNVRNAYLYIDDINEAKAAAKRSRQYEMAVGAGAIVLILVGVYRCRKYAMGADRRVRERRAKRLLNSGGIS